MSRLRDAWNNLTGPQKGAAATFIQNSIADVLAVDSTAGSVVSRTPNAEISLEIYLEDRELNVRIRKRFA